MKLLLRRGQKSGMFSRITFTLEVRAELTKEEEASITKYQMGSEIIYHEEKVATGRIDPSTWGTFGRGLGRSLMAKMLNLTITVDDLARGKRIECKDILEMIAAEQQILEAARTFKNILDAAARFGGDEVVEV